MYCLVSLFYMDFDLMFTSKNLPFGTRFATKKALKNDSKKITPKTLKTVEKPDLAVNGKRSIEFAALFATQKAFKFIFSHSWLLSGRSWPLLSCSRLLLGRSWPLLGRS